MLVKVYHTPDFPFGKSRSRRGCSRCGGVLLEMAPAFAGELPSHAGFPAGASRSRRGCSRCGGVPLETAPAFAGERPSHAEVFPAGGISLPKGPGPQCAGVLFRNGPAFAGELPSHAGFPAGVSRSQWGWLSVRRGRLPGHATTMLIEAGTDVKFPGEKLGEKTVSFPRVL